MVKLSVTEAWIAILSVFLILAPVLTQTDSKYLGRYPDLDMTTMSYNYMHL